MGSLVLATASRLLYEVGNIAGLGIHRHSIQGCPPDQQAVPPEFEIL